MWLAIPLRLRPPLKMKTAQIVTTADTIIPGHGLPIRVDTELLHVLLERFPYAEYASQCPDVHDMLQRRLEECCGGQA